MEKIEKELRLLKGYAVCSLVMFAALISLAAKNPGKRTKFEEIDAERINIVESDGKVRLTLANHQKMPGGQLAGLEVTSRAGNRTMMAGGPPNAGMLFFDDDGNEVGGLLYGSKSVNGRSKAGVDLTFDHHDQNEAIGIVHGEDGSASRSGLEVWDTGAPFTTDFIQRSNAIAQMKDGPEKTAAQNKVAKDHASELKFASRLFVGRLAENNAASVILRDTQSNPRIQMTVGEAGDPVLEFLDARGKVTYRLSEHGATQQ